MTAAQPPAGSSPHPDLDTLADLDAGVLEGTDAERIGVHVAGCVRCGQVLAALGGVRADLRGLAAPPVPAAVAARLESTLADLRADPDRSAPAGDAPVADLATVRDRRSRRLRMAAGAVAAGFAVVVAGVSVGALVRSSGSSTSVGAGGGLAEQRTTGPEQRTTGPQADSAAGGGAGAAPGGAQVPAPSALPPLPSYDRSTLRAALPGLAASYTVTRVAKAGEGGPAGVMADAGRRTACVQTIPGRQGDVRAVRWIRYEGRPAYVFVLDDGGRITAYVVSEDCGSIPSVPATVLDTLR